MSFVEFLEALSRLAEKISPIYKDEVLFKIIYKYL